MPIISYQLYSSRNWDEEETLSMLADVGIRHFEGFGPFVEKPAETKALLERHGISMPTSHFALDLVEREPETVVATAKQLGIEVVVIPYIALEDRPKTLTGWQQFGQRLAKAAEPIIAAGLDFAWHNHDFEFVAVEGAMPLDIIANASDDIKIELDLAWVAVAGQDPVAWLNRLTGRLAAVHIKDIAAAGENTDEDGWSDVGYGTLDWTTIKPAMDTAGVERYIIEHDNPSDHERMTRRSLATVKAF